MENTIVTILVILIGLMFLFTGGTKLIGVQMHIDNFKRWGYPDWFRYVVGIIEVVGALLVLGGRFIEGQMQLTMIGAAILVLTMIGAVITHIRASENTTIPMPLVLGIVAAFIFLVANGNVTV